MANKRVTKKKTSKPHGAPKKTFTRGGVTRESGGRGVTAIVRGNSADQVMGIITKMQGFALDAGLDQVEIMSVQPSPAGGWEAVVRAHNFNPIKWIKDKIARKKKGEEDEDVLEEAVVEEVGVPSRTLPPMKIEEPFGRTVEIPGGEAELEAVTEVPSARPTVHTEPTSGRALPMVVAQPRVTEERPTTAVVVRDVTDEPRERRSVRESLGHLRERTTGRGPTVREAYGTAQRLAERGRERGQRAFQERQLARAEAQRRREAEEMKRKEQGYALFGEYAGSPEQRARWEKTTEELRGKPSEETKARVGAERRELLAEMTEGLQEKDIKRLERAYQKDLPKVKSEAMSLGISLYHASKKKRVKDVEATKSAREKDPNAPTVYKWKVEGGRPKSLAELKVEVSKHKREMRKLEPPKYKTALEVTEKMIKEPSKWAAQTLPTATAQAVRTGPRAFQRGRSTLAGPYIHPEEIQPMGALARATVPTPAFGPTTVAPLAHLRELTEPGVTPSPVGSVPSGAMGVTRMPWGVRGMSPFSRRIRPF